MGKVSAELLIAAPLAAVWDYYFEPATWPAWVDQFGRVDASDGYPEAGGTLRWNSTRAGRGRVTERVIAHEPRSLHRVEFADPESEGTLEVRFAIEPGEGTGRTRVKQAMEYRITSGGPLSGITDALFVRTQVRRSLERSLGRLKTEIEAGEAAEEAPAI
jgi:uncharacterized membrane protein